MTKLIYERSKPGRRASSLPRYDLPPAAVPPELARTNPPRLPGGRRFRRPLPHRRAGRRSVRSARTFRDTVPQAFARPAGAGAIGPRRARSLAAMASADIDLAERLRQSAARAAAETGEAAAVERALELLLPLAGSCGGNPARFLDAVSLASDADFSTQRAQGVGAVDLARRQGTELACVFIVGLEDGVLPLRFGEGRGCGAGGVGRGAPAVLRRHDPRKGPPGAEPRAQAAVAPQRARAGAFAVPRRHRERARQGAAADLRRRPKDRQLKLL